MERLSTSISQNCETLIRRRALLKHNAVTRGWYRKALPGFGGKYIRLKAARYKLRLLMLLNPRLHFQQFAVLAFKRAVSACAFAAVQGCVCLSQQCRRRRTGKIVHRGDAQTDSKPRATSPCMGNFLGLHGLSDAFTHVPRIVGPPTSSTTNSSPP